MKSKEKQLIQEFKRKKRIIIYGAGMVGQQFWRWLKSVGLADRVLAFAVTYKGDNRDEIDGVPVCEISELDKYNKSSSVIVATLPDYHKEIVNTLNKYTFENIVLYDQVLYHDVISKAVNKKELYICATYYHVLISITKILVYKQDADMVLTDGLKKNFDLSYKLKKNKCVNNVFHYDNARSIGFEPTESGIKCLFRKRKDIKCFEKEFTLNIHNYNMVNVFYDYNKLGRYLQAKRCKYRLIEDCYDFMKLVIPIRFGDLANYWGSKQYKIDNFLGMKYQAFGQSKHCKSIEVNSKEEIRISDKKVVVVPREELFAKLNIKSKETIYKVFAEDKQIGTIEGKNILVLTQPLYKDGYVPSIKIQEDIYVYIFKELCKGYDKIYLKAHPRDDYPYSKLDIELSVIDKNIPTEVFNFKNEVLFNKAITINSTAIYSMNFVEEKQMLGIEFLEKFVDKANMQNQ